MSSAAFVRGARPCDVADAGSTFVAPSELPHQPATTFAKKLEEMPAKTLAIGTEVERIVRRASSAGSPGPELHHCAKGADVGVGVHQHEPLDLGLRDQHAVERIRMFPFE